MADNKQFNAGYPVHSKTESSMTLGLEGEFLVFLCLGFPLALQDSGILSIDKPSFHSGSFCR